MKNKRNASYSPIIAVMSKSNRTVSQTIFLAVFIMAGIFNVSYGQSKADKLDKFISTYADYGQFNG